MCSKGEVITPYMTSLNLLSKSAYDLLEAIRRGVVECGGKWGRSDTHGGRGGCT